MFMEVIGESYGGWNDLFFEVFSFVSYVVSSYIVFIKIKKMII